MRTRSLRKLQELMVKYVACNFEKLWKNPEFQSFFNEQEELSAPVMEELMGRLA